MAESQRRLDELRRRSTEVENHLIDELRAGKIDRREFIRRGTVVGMSIPLLGFVASACGVSREDIERKDAPQTGTPERGGTIRAGSLIPATALDPLTVSDQGGLGVLGQTGEYLIWSDRELKAQPRLAESWAPTEDGQVWRFKIREGVTFHDGTPLDAEDVATTFNRLADPDARLQFAVGLHRRALQGRRQGRRRHDRGVPARREERQLPVPRQLGQLQRDHPPARPTRATGRRRSSGPARGSSTASGRARASATPATRTTGTRTGCTVADKSEVRFYSNEQSLVFGLQGNEVDILVQFSVAGGKALLTDPDVRTIELAASAHRQVHLNNATEQFKDKRTRQAIGLLVNRRALVDGLLDTKADPGNDSPFAPVFPSTAEVRAARAGRRARRRSCWPRPAWRTASACS